MSGRAKVISLAQTRPAQGGQKVAFHFGQGAASNRGPGHQNQVQRGGALMLLPPVGLPQKTSRPAPRYSGAHLPAGDDT